MRIAILTLQYANNYGALLQAYALKQYLIQLGCTVDIINYSPTVLSDEYSLNPIRCSRTLRGRISNALKIVGKKKSQRLFEQFRVEHLGIDKNNRIITRDSFESYINNFDICVIGSDQVWNSDIVKKDPIFFGSFKAQETQVCSYAASIGKSALDSFQKEMFIASLEDFKFVSVREDSAKRNINKILPVLNIQVVADPVFLLSEDIWETLEKRPFDMKVQGHYLLYYSLQEDNSMEESAKRIAKDKGLSIVTIHPTNNYNSDIGIKIYNVGPMEFIWLLHHADCVVSNSFHAAAFSVVFQKILFPHIHTKTGSRVLELLNWFTPNSDGAYSFTNTECEKFWGFVRKSKKYLIDNLIYS